jgi:hypothetical protein
MAIATTMFFTGIDPLTMEPVPVARDLRDKRMMKALLYYWDESHHDLAREALKKAGRQDLIGHGPRCLVPPPGRVRPPAAPGGLNRKAGRREGLGGRETQKRRGRGG